MSDMDYDTRGRLVAQAFFSELEKIAAGEFDLNQPQVGMMDQAEGMGGQGSDTEVWQNEAAPAHGVVASRVTQLDPRRAVSIPEIQAPPGYVYSSDLAAFVPNPSDPGWMSVRDAMEAARNKGWYQAGQQDTVTQQAQQSLDDQVQADVEQDQMNQMQAQQQGMMQQAADQEGMMTQAKEQAKQNVNPKPQPAPKSQSAKKPSSSKKAPAKKSEGKSEGKGVTIRIGQ